MADCILTSSPSLEDSFHDQTSSKNAMISEYNSEDAGALRFSKLCSPKPQEEERSVTPDIESGARSGASLTAHELLQTGVRANISTPKRPQRWGSHYHERLASNIPVYKSPGSTDVATKIQPTMNRKPNITGAHKPVNTLKVAQNGARSPAETQRNSQKREKVFDLHHPESPLKRQKLSENLMSQQQSLGNKTVYVDLDADDGNTQSSDRHSQGRAVPQRNLPPSELGTNVKEYKHVEDMMVLGGKKKRHPRRVEYSIQNGQGLYGRDMASQQSPDLDVMETERPRAAQVTTGYKGTANHRPARDLYQQRESRSNSVQSSSTSGKESRYFQEAPAQYPQNVRRGSTASSSHRLSQSVPETQSSRRNSKDAHKPQAPRPVSAGSLPNDISGIRPGSKPTQHDTETTYEDDDSIDLISEDHYPEKKARRPSDIMAPFKKQSKLADIVPTQFTNGKKPRISANSGACRQTHLSEFTVIYALSGTKEIPCGPLNNPLRIKPDSKNIWQPFGEKLDAEDFPMLIINPNTIQRIIYSESSSKVFISRAASTYPPIPNTLCLELEGSTGGCLVQQIQSTNSVDIKAYVQDPSKLDQIFEKQKSIASQEIVHHRSVENVGSEDVQFLENKKHRKNPRTYMKSVEIQTQASCNAANQNLRQRHSQPQIQQDQKIGNSHFEDPFTEKNDDQVAEEPRGGGLSTRSTTRSRQPARIPSPEPIKWTVENPDWKKLWIGSPALELQYPFDDRNKAVVSIEDIYRLDENEMLNDNLVVFYLRVLEYNLQKSNPDLARRIYFNNSFFYNTLTGSGRSGKGKGISYEAVQRWTSRVNIFSYDYIIVPVCEETHWYVAIICNAPRMIEDEIKAEVKGKVDEKSSAILEDKSGAETPQKLTESEDSSSINIGSLHISSDPPKDCAKSANKHAQGTEVKSTKKNENAGYVKVSTPADTKKSKRRVSTSRKYNPKEPRIITLDSLNYSRSPACNNLKNWLIAEAKAKLGQDITIERLGLTAKGLPEQENMTDCGVFLLAYIEQFLKDPDNFVCDILEGKRDLEKNWEGWTAQKIPELRREMRDMIFKFRREFMDIRKRERAERRERMNKKPDAEQTGIPEAVTLQSGDDQASPEASPEESSEKSEEKPAENTEEKPEEKLEEPSSDSDHTPPMGEPESATDSPAEDRQAQEESPPKPPLGQRLVQDFRDAKKEIKTLPHKPYESRASKPSIGHRLADKFLEVGQSALKAFNGGDCQKKEEEAPEIIETSDSDSQSHILTPFRKKQPNQFFNKSIDTTSGGVALGSAPDSPFLLDDEEKQHMDFVSNRHVPGSVNSPLQVDDSQENNEISEIVDSSALQKKTYSDEGHELRFNSYLPVRSPNKQRVNIDSQSPRAESSRVTKRDSDGHPVTPHRTTHRGEIAISPPQSSRSTTNSSSPQIHPHKRLRHNNEFATIDITES